MNTTNGSLDLRVVPYRLYDFSGVTGTSLGGSITITLAEHIEAHPFTEIDLAVRTHAGTVVGSTPKPVVSLVPEGYAVDDPATQFFGTALASVTLTTAGTNYYLASATTGIGNLVAVQLTVTLGVGLPKVYLSVDLTLKGGNPVDLPLGPNSFTGFRIR